MTFSPLAKDVDSPDLHSIMATKILKDNYLVEMDAAHSVVKILKKGEA